MGREAVTAVKLEGEEERGLGSGEEGEVRVGDNHAAEMEGAEEVEGGGLGDASEPGSGGASPIAGDEVEHSGTGFGFELKGEEAGKAPGQDGGGGRVGHGDGDVAASAGVGAVPAAADEGDGVTVAGVVDVGQHQLQRYVGDAEAHGPPEFHHR